MPKGMRHGHTWIGGKSPTYSSWSNMMARCFQPSNPAYAYYRERGITVCKRWHKFDNFLVDMGERPEGRSTIERINNGLGYSPKNCRWATRREQANNRITNIYFEYYGQMFTLAELARVTGKSKETLRARLCRSKLPWTVEGAVRTPTLPRNLRKSGFHC